MLSTNDDMASSSSRVRRVPQHEMSIRVRERLDLLIDAAGEIATADTIEKLAHAALDAIIGGTGFPRAAFIRRLHSGEFDARSQVEVVASRVAASVDPAVEFDSFSLTMLRAADDGKLVVLDGGVGAIPQGQSLIDLRIQYALCAPIILDAIPAAYLYLDARVHEPAPGTINVNPVSSLNSDAPAFAQAVARLCGLAMANINRLALDRRRRELEDDLLAARAAQSLLMPKPHGGLGAFRYAVHSTPGRLVAGDLFDTSLLPDGRLAVVIGDVMGKGVGAAILMSGAQAHLTASLRYFGEPAAAVNETNRYIQAHAQPGCFISLMAAIIDPRSGSMSFVDAGHGHWMLRLPATPPRQIPCVGGPPINVDPDAVYVNESAEFPVGASLLLYSDGLVEQRSPAGEMFGADRVPDALGDSDDPRRIVDALTARLREFSGDSARLDDDVTIAVVRRDA
jgi:serine phosphatase RsbU (regulator of sigma subunit)